MADNRKLFDLMQNQEERRTRSDMFRHHELDELAAMKRLAFDLFGERSLLEVNPAEPGIVYIGVYDRVYPRSVPAARRKRALVLRGRSHADLVAQAKILKAAS